MASNRAHRARGNGVDRCALTPVYAGLEELEAEADQICGAQRYEHTADRVDTRAGHYECKLETKARVVTLKMPKLRKLPFEDDLRQLLGCAAHLWHHGAI